MNTDLWAEYARLQAIADCPRLHTRTQGAEEALNAMLDRIEFGEPASTQQADDLVANRARTLRARRRLLERHATEIGGENCSPSNHEACFELARHAENCGGRDWRILVSIGAGNTYRDVAALENVPEGTIKTWVSRARLKLRAA